MVKKNLKNCFLFNHSGLLLKEKLLNVILSVSTLLPIIFNAFSYFCCYYYGCFSAQVSFLFSLSSCMDPKVSSSVYQRGNGWLVKPVVPASFITGWWQMTTASLFFFFDRAASYLLNIIIFVLQALPIDECTDWLKHILRKLELPAAYAPCTMLHHHITTGAQMDKPEFDFTADC